MRRAALIAVVAAFGAASACNALTGVGDFTFEGPGGAAAAGPTHAHVSASHASSTHASSSHASSSHATSSHASSSHAATGVGGAGGGPAGAVFGEGGHGLFENCYTDFAAGAPVAYDATLAHCGCQTDAGSPCSADTPSHGCPKGNCLANDCTGHGATAACAACLECEAEKGSGSTCVQSAFTSANCTASADCTNFFACIFDDMQSD